jgi:hypothetical protein
MEDGKIGNLTGKPLLKRRVSRKAKKASRLDEPKNSPYLLNLSHRNVYVITGWPSDSCWLKESIATVSIAIH